MTHEAVYVMEGGAVKLVRGPCNVQLSRSTCLWEKKLDSEEEGCLLAKHHLPQPGHAVKLLLEPGQKIQIFDKNARLAKSAVGPGVATLGVHDHFSIFSVPGENALESVKNIILLPADEQKTSFRFHLTTSDNAEWQLCITYSWKVGEMSVSPSEALLSEALSNGTLATANRKIETAVRSEASKLAFENLYEFCDRMLRRVLFDYGEREFVVPLLSVNGNIPSALGFFVSAAKYKSILPVNDVAAQLLRQRRKWATILHLFLDHHVIAVAQDVVAYFRAKNDNHSAEDEEEEQGSEAPAKRPKCEAEIKSKI